MIVLQLCTGERVMVNEANIDCVKEARDELGNYVSHVYAGRCVLKVRQSFEEISQLIGYEGVALPVAMNVHRPQSTPTASDKKTPPELEDKFRGS